MSMVWYFLLSALREAMPVLYMTAHFVVGWVLFSCILRHFVPQVAESVAARKAGYVRSRSAAKDDVAHEAAKAAVLEGRAAPNDLMRHRNGTTAAVVRLKAHDDVLAQGLALLEHYGALGAPCGSWHAAVSRDDGSSEIHDTNLHECMHPAQNSKAVKLKVADDPGLALLDQYDVFGVKAGAWATRRNRRGASAGA